MESWKVRGCDGAGGEAQREAHMPFAKEFI